jgi:monoamine oxidase
VTHDGSADRPDHRDVVVIGAGTAGLAAANLLSGAGRSVTVLEARDRVGGRAHTVATPHGPVDLGASWFWPGERLVGSLAAELGLGTFAQHLAGDAVFEPVGTGPQRLAGNPIDVPSGRFVRGAQELCRRLADRLPVGVLRLEEPVSAVTLTGPGVRVEHRSGVLTAADVVLAVPPPLAVEQIRFVPPLPEGVRSSAESIAVWMGGTVKAVAVFEHPFWRAVGMSGSAVSHQGPFQELHDHSGPDGAPAAIFGFAPADRFAGIGTPEVAAAFGAQLVRLFGPAAEDPLHVHVTDWSRERFTTPRTPARHATSAGFGAPALQIPVGGRIHWASTETATTHAGHLEGALDAGMAAARAILRARA